MQKLNTVHEDFDHHRHHFQQCLLCNANSTCSWGKSFKLTHLVVKCIVCNYTYLLGSYLEELARSWCQIGVAVQSYGCGEKIHTGLYPLPSGLGLEKLETATPECLGYRGLAARGSVCAKTLGKQLGDKLVDNMLAGATNCSNTNVNYMT